MTKHIVSKIRERIINIKRRIQKRKTTKQDRKIKRISQRCPRLPATQILAEIDSQNIASRTIQRRLIEAGFPGRTSAQKPLLSKK